MSVLVVILGWKAKVVKRGMPTLATFNSFRPMIIILLQPKKRRVPGENIRICGFFFRDFFSRKQKKPRKILKSGPALKSGWRMMVEE